MAELAREQARQIIRTHRSDPLPDDVKKPRREIIEMASKDETPLEDP